MNTLIRHFCEKIFLNGINNPLFLKKEKKNQITIYKLLR